MTKNKSVVINSSSIGSRLRISQTPWACDDPL